MAIGSSHGLAKRPSVTASARPSGVHETVTLASSPKASPRYASLVHLAMAGHARTAASRRTTTGRLVATKSRMKRSAVIGSLSPSISGTP